MCRKDKSGNLLPSPSLHNTSTSWLKTVVLVLCILFSSFFLVNIEYITYVCVLVFYICTCIAQSWLVPGAYLSMIYNRTKIHMYRLYVIVPYTLYLIHVCELLFLICYYEFYVCVWKTKRCKSDLATFTSAAMLSTCICMSCSDSQTSHKYSFSALYHIQVRMQILYSL